MNQTLPKPLKPEGIILNPKDLAAGRYGTHEMVEIWGPEKTFEFSLKVQAKAIKILSELYPDLVSSFEANEILEKANLKNINPDRIRELENKTGHDVIAINTALEEVVSEKAAAHINKARTSADTTQTAKALQIKKALEIISDSLENLRDILIEKSIEWMDVPHMDTTHLYDALPTVAGRVFVHYAEMLSSDLEFLKFVYDKSLMGKWADATGNHHSAVALGIDGMKLQEEYCNRLKINNMVAPSQVPGLEFEADVFYVLSRIGETLNNIAKYIALGRGDDMSVFVNSDPKKKKGSSAMPHKDAKNGNPTTEEQIMSLRNYLLGNLTTAMINCEMPYARNLAASSNSRINFEDGFKFIDHGIRKLANTIYWISIKRDECIKRVDRSYGVVTSQQVMTYLTDKSKISNPMTRSQAHDLIGQLATQAWDLKVPFIEVLLKNYEVTTRINEDVLRKITDPHKYIGQSKEIINKIKELYYQKKLFVKKISLGEFSYAKSGVDVDVESKGATILFEAAKKTFENRKGNLGEIITPFEDFSGVRVIDVSKLPENSLMCMGFDGVGTKAEIAQRMNKHDTIAFDLIAMVCDDAILRGGEPVLVGSILDVNTLGTDETRLVVLKQLAEGYIKAAKEANVAVINGELAQLGKAVGGHGDFVYNWGASLVWFANKDKLFTGKEIKEGDFIVVLQEKGFRANGLSLVRKVFKEKLGENWHNFDFKGKKLGEHVLEPSIIYSKAIVHMHGGFKTPGCCEIHGIVHITGGGVKEKFLRVLKPSGFGAELDNLFEPCDAMKYCQELGNVSDEEAYKTWNMGQGLAVITPEPEKVVLEAKKFGIEGKIAGRIIGENKIKLRSKGVFSKDKELIF